MKIPMFCAVAVASWTAFSWAAPLPESPRPPGGARTAIFISDLHLGVGRDPKSLANWHVLEDFRWEQEFSDFLTHINQEEKGKVDLVLLGDVLELWQSLSPTDCRHEKISKDLGCTEEEAKARAQRALDEHPEVLRKLSWFARQGNNRVTIVPGNHDAALLFPAVHQLVLDRIKAPADRLRIAPEGYWWSADGKIVAEHGHQMGSDPNRFEGWPENPFLKNQSLTYLQQPWGEQMVQQIFNEREEAYPAVDNLSEELLGIRYILRSQTAVQKLSSAGDLARFILLQTSWKQSRQGLGGGSEKQDPLQLFDLAKVRESYKTAPERFLVESMSPDDPLRGALEAALKEGQRLPKIEDLSDEEVLALCAQRLVYNETAAANRHLPACETRTGLSAAAQALNEALPGAKDRRIREYLQQLQSDLPAAGRTSRQFTHYIYAHTHKEERLQPFSETGKPIVWNDGAWQRRATPEQLCTVIRKKKLKEEEALLKIVPEDLPACYSFVRARWGEGRTEPEVRLLYWVQETGKRGDLRGDCGFVIDSACLGSE